MKTFSSSIRQNHDHIPTFMTQFIPLMAASVRDVVAVLCALLAAAALILLFIWAAGMNISVFLGAGIWVMGFVFLGLALDNRGLPAVAQTTSGLTLLALALLQSSVSPDFVIISGVVLAGWVAVGLFRHLSCQDS